MSSHSKEQPQKPGPVQTSQDSRAEADRQKQKAAEQEEVAGLHKNDGKNDHASHKVTR